jgi:RNase P subunit RPR2
MMSLLRTAYHNDFFQGGGRRRETTHHIANPYVAMVLIEATIARKSNVALPIEIRLQICDLCMYKW